MLDEKAKDLGRQIGQSPEYQALKRFNDALMQDAEAAPVLRQLSELRGQAEEYLERGENPPMELEESLNTLMLSFQTNTAYQSANSAQINFDKLMVRVNEWISEGIRSGAVSKIITLS